MTYTKFTHPENISLWYTPCQQLIQIKPAFYGGYLTHNIPHSSDTIIQVFHFHDGDTPIQLGLL